MRGKITWWGRHGARWPAVAGLLAGGLLLAAVGAAAWLWRAPLPQLAGTVHLAGRVRLAGPQRVVRIARDAHGVPHVDAGSERDAVLATGFVHGQDRLFQMDLLRRAGSGRLAELFGTVAVDRDRRARREGHASRAAAALAAASSEVRELLAAYAEGLNTAAGRGVRPPEYTLLQVGFEPWTPSDSLLVMAVMQERLTESSRELTRYRLAERVGAAAATFLLDARLVGDTVTLDQGATGRPPPDPGALQAEAAATRRRLLAEAAALGLPLHPPEEGREEGGAAARQPPPGPHRPASRPPPAAGAGLPGAWPESPAALGLGSNAWVVDGRRTAAGAPLLANDTHLGLEMPSPFYLIDLAWPGTQVAGVTVPGFPGVVIGRNRRIAWGVTILTADGIDYVVERLVPGDPGRYLAEGVAGGLPFQVRMEEIQVRGGDPVPLEIHATRHGPVVDPDWRPGEVLVQAPPPAPGDELEAVRGFAAAGDFAAFQAAAARHGRPFENLLYADVDGHIGYVAAGAIPRRGERSGLLPVPGWRTAAVFSGWDPAGDRPRVLDPPAGRLVSANNRVLHGPRGESWNGAWIRGDRAARATALLAASPRHDAASFRRMQADTASRQAEMVLAALAAAATAGAWQPPASAPEAIAWSLLKDWDGRYDGGPAPGLFALFWHGLKAAVFADDAGTDLAAAADAGLLKLLAPHRFLDGSPAAARDWLDDGRTPRREGLTEQVAAALRAAWDEMVRRAGPEPGDWDWRRLHQARFVHPLGRHRLLAPLFNGPSVPVAGTGGVLLATACIPGRSFDVVALPAMRMLADLSPGGGLRMIIPIGQSGLPASPHFDDQAGLWAAFQDLPIFLDEAARAALTTHTLLLEPAP